jgi:aldehyde dehydrogenase (NAD+)
MQDMERRDQLFIGGEWVAPNASGSLDVISPVSEERIACVPDPDEVDVDRAVAAAREAFDHGPFPHWSPAERAAAIRRLSAAITKRGPEITETIARQNGAPIQSAFGTQVFAATMALDACAKISESYPFEEDRTGAMGQRVRIRRAPVGVCALVIPWNVPLYLAVTKLGPALAAGCTAVLKPAPETALDPYLLADAILEAEIPPGVINIVTAGRNASEALVRHPGVDKVSFTGSSATGARIAEICGSQIKRCTLELGGKSAAILLDDFDASASTEALIGAGTLNNGQACAAQTRILAPRARYSEITEALAATLGAMKVGDNMDPETRIGPLVAERQRDRVAGMLARAKEAGARALCGGGRPADLDRGWFIEPTLFTEVDNTMEIAREEIFGPVLVAIPYDDEDHAVAIANDSPFGLGGGIWTEDSERGAAVATRLRSGAITINHAMLLDFNCPFGGFKRSGLGRELGPEGIDSYVELQSIIFSPAGQAAASG